MEPQSKNVIVEKTFQFSLASINYCELLEEKKKFIVARQLLRSATSVGANVREAQHSESRHDFTHKMKIAIKEAEETAYWLDICAFAPSYPSPEGLQEKIQRSLKY